MFIGFKPMHEVEVEVKTNYSIVNNIKLLKEGQMIVQGLFKLFLSLKII